MQERPDLTAFVIGKVPLIPDGAFVEQQCIPLRVPVTGDSEGTGSIEVDSFKFTYFLSMVDMDLAPSETSLRVG